LLSESQPDEPPPDSVAKSPRGTSYMLTPAGDPRWLDAYLHDALQYTQLRCRRIYCTESSSLPSFGRFRPKHK